MRENTRQITVGGVRIGGGAPVVIQSMTNTKTEDGRATLRQIEELAEAGCELIRVAVPDDAAAAKLPEIVRFSPIPVIADIHFDYRLALKALDAGMPALRINPGNLLKHDPDGRLVTGPLDTLARELAAHDAAVRVGVNSGSVEKDLLTKYGGPVPEALVESALRHTALLEGRGVHKIKVSLKSSSVADTIAAYELMDKRTDYPLHIGVTEAGTLLRGAIKSAVGLGWLLMRGIGDTMRVSLTADPVREIEAAKEILRASGVRSIGPEIISCPTCGRTRIDLFRLADEVERHVRHIRSNIKIAVMGCVVNGPGEAREADIGLAGGIGKGVIFRKGEVIRSVNGEDALLTAFLEEIDRLDAEICHL